MPENRPRLKAAAIFFNDGRMLVQEVWNHSDGRTWFIPPGGGVKPGEDCRDAMKREIMEELGWEIASTQLVGAFESSHAINGAQEHEKSFVYFATPVDRSVFGSGGWKGDEADRSVRLGPTDPLFTMEWKSSTGTSTLKY